MTFDFVTEIVYGVTSAVTLLDKLSHGKRMNRDDVIENARRRHKIGLHIGSLKNCAKDIAVASICADTSK